jgi:hypothetical protein
MVMTRATAHPCVTANAFRAGVPISPGTKRQRPARPPSKHVSYYNVTDIADRAAPIETPEEWVSFGPAPAYTASGAPR